jgi:hypothetical protein
MAPHSSYSQSHIFFGFFYCFIIRMCIQGLGHFSPMLSSHTLWHISVSSHSIPEIPIQYDKEESLECTICILSQYF